MQKESLIWDYLVDEKVKFSEDSLRDSEDGTYVSANAVLFTKEQYKQLLKELDFPEDVEVKFDRILGLNIYFAEGLDKPKVIRL